MRILCPLLLALPSALLMGACATQAGPEAPAGLPELTPPRPVLDMTTSVPPAPASMPEGVSYDGGDGTSPAQAVIVNGVTTARAATRAEYAWLRNRYPGFKRQDEKLVRSKGRYYDALAFVAADGSARTIYFDVSATIRKRGS